MAKKSAQDAVSAFGAAATGKLTSASISGAPEDQLRGPVELLVRELGEIGGLPAGSVLLVGETTLPDIKTRPDFAVNINKALVGFIEVKAPGKGADPRKFKDEHDREQWARLKSLPNLVYTDGNAFSLWRDGEIVGAVVRLDGDIESSGASLKAPPTLLPLFVDFLSWQPIPPSNAKKLAEIAARLCRLLRDEVTEQLDRGSPGLTALATDWRKLLFPDANNAQFADGYAQAVTFGLLVARARDIDLSEGIHHAAEELRKTNSLVGSALGLLTDDGETRDALNTSLGTLVRVLNVVNWHTISKDKPEAWLYFYEDFLAIYDNALRKRTGSYYTPPEVVEAMVRLCDDVLRGPLFERASGFASADVTVADPAVGTGTYLLGVLRRIAATVEADQGAGAVRAAIRSAAERIIGFEIQFGPFAVAQLRLIAEMQTLMSSPGDPSPSLPPLKLFITDTLGNPFAEEEYLPLAVQAIAQSRKDANAIKRGQPITVVIGNPPYKEKAEGRGGWVEAGSGDERPALLDLWRAPREWSVGPHAKHLKNLYVYFWRWATWKVFGSGHYAATGLPQQDEEGIVCFITVAGFLNGPGFQKMRDDLRQTCSAIWVIDCSPEGHQPEVATRIFQGVQQPVCIVLAARKLGKEASSPARVHFRSLPTGRREEKFAALAALSPDGPGWVDCPTGGRDPFLPAAEGAWANFPALKDFFIYDGSGVMPGRTWIIAPDKASLEARWQRLTSEQHDAEKERLFHPHLRKGEPGDKHLHKPIERGLAGHEERLDPVIDDTGSVIVPVRYAFRTLDRQWIIPDARLINQPNPTIWNAHSVRQVYLTTLQAHAPTSGPAISFAGLIPDLHHYKGSFGGRAHPLWRNRQATEPNINPELQPGLRVPLTADAALFGEGVALGREVIWLHTYGERFADPEAGRPKGPPRLPKGAGPTIPADGAIPSTELPETIVYDPTKRRLHIGKGFVENVTPAMWAYEVSGKQVLTQWFSYRRRDRSRPVIGDRRPPSPLDSIQPDGWIAEYTTDLLDLLHVLGRLVQLEPAQADLLDQICAGKLITVDDLGTAGVLAMSAETGAAEETGADDP